MQKTMVIEGMMCQHCEARVKKCLEALEQVESAQVNHNDGTAVVTLKSDIADDVLKSTVEAQDYKVVSVK
ncbi:MAG: heavy-metal-associated domain-containing protein [Acutalibacteraceae bacterium]